MLRADGLISCDSCGVVIADPANVQPRPCGTHFCRMPCWAALERSPPSQATGIHGKNRSMYTKQCEVCGSPIRKYNKSNRCKEHLGSYLSERVRVAKAQVRANTNAKRPQAQQGEDTASPDPDPLP